MLILIIIFVMIPANNSAQAKSTLPYVVINENVWLIDNQDTPIFMLPSSYVAPISKMENNYYFVTFNGVSGKVSTENVTVIEYSGIAPETRKTISLSDELNDIPYIILKSRPDTASVSIAEIPNFAIFTYIGSYPTAEEVWYYVAYADNYGYIKANRTDSPNIDNGTFTTESNISQEPSNTDDKSFEGLLSDKDKDKWLTITIITSLTIPAIFIIVLIFKPRKNIKKDKYYDE